MSALYAMFLMGAPCAGATDPTCTMEALETELKEIVASGRKLKRNKPWTPDLRTRAEAGREKVTNGWLRCTRTKAIEYASLSETAEAVAKTAYSACGEWTSAYQAWNFTVFEASGASLSTANSTFALVEVNFRQSLVTFVMDLRVRNRQQN